jgi:uncharacterized RDD family membrane protein YckC
MNDVSQESVSADAIFQIAGFWRRLLAFVIDVLVLALVGFALGTFFYDDLAKLGSRGRVIGFLIAVIYFGLMNSRIRNGQSVGKAFAKLKVVGSDGNRLGIGRSFLRSGVLCLPYFLSAVPLQSDLNAWLGFLFFVLVFGGGISIVYLFVFNRRTRQSLHDLVVGSYVARADTPTVAPAVNIWRGHYPILATVILVSFVGSLFVGKSEPFASLASLQKDIASDPLIQDVGITDGRIWSTSGKSSTSNLSVRVSTGVRNADFDSLANRLARTILDKYPNAASRDVIGVSISYGYDIGIASSSHTRNYFFTPEQWRQRIGSMSA